MNLNMTGVAFFIFIRSQGTESLGAVGPHWPSGHPR